MDNWHSYKPLSSSRTDFIRSDQWPMCLACSTRNRSSLLYVDKPTVNNWKSRRRIQETWNKNKYIAFISSTSKYCSVLQSLALNPHYNIPSSCLTLCAAKFNQKPQCLYVSFNIKLIIIRIVQMRRCGDGFGNEKKVCNVQLVSCCVINETNRKLHIPRTIRSIHNEMEKVFQINPTEHWLNFNFHGALGKPMVGEMRMVTLIMLSAKLPRNVNTILRIACQMVD